MEEIGPLSTNLSGRLQIWNDIIDSNIFSTEVKGDHYFCNFYKKVIDIYKSKF